LWRASSLLVQIRRALPPIRSYRQMSLALEINCGKFGMKLADDPATRVVALKIIELAQRGVRDAPTLSEMTLKELKHYLPYAGA